MIPRHVFPRGAHQRRRLPEVRTDPLATSSVLDGSPLTMIALSHRGCAVTSQCGFGIGEELHLTLAIDADVSFIVPVRVAYSRPTHRSRPSRRRYLTGFEFVAAGQPDIHRIVDVLLDASNQPLSVH